MKTNPTVCELRRAGNQVFIRHVREFIGVERMDDDEFMTRGEYEEARQNGEIMYIDAFAEDFYREQGVARGVVPQYSRAVSPINGWTEVSVVTPEGSTVKGKYNFDNKPFCRKLGTSIALSKALFKLTDEYQRRETKKNEVVAL